MSFIVPSSARSWIRVERESHFPIQNLPFCNFIRLKEGEIDEEAVVTAGIAIGDQILDIRALAEEGVIQNVDPELCWLDALNANHELNEIREAAFELLREDNPRVRDNAHLRETALLNKDQAMLVDPFTIGAYADFYSGIHHASNVGEMFRPDQPPLMPNYRWIPIGYNGRASSVVLSGEPIVRPKGQTKGPNDETPVFGPSKELDFELEMGFFLSEGCDLGDSIAVDDCEHFIAGLVLVNDWSARDIQRWEYQPLGPFLAKSFGTSISPWVVLIDALEPFRIQGMEQDPQPLEYLRQADHGHFDIELEVSLKTPAMTRPQVISRSNTKHLYWTMAQQLAHQTSNGTNVQPGDLYASGTISGPDPGTYGSLLELTWRGTQPITLDETGETRTFLEDGDTVIMTGWAQGEEYCVGFGEIRTTVFPAR